jgi:hypothetical protein
MLAEDLTVDVRAVPHRFKSARRCGSYYNSANW